jgi:REP element-mobilizing transposase RayT
VQIDQRRMRYKTPLILLRGQGMSVTIFPHAANLRRGRYSEVGRAYLITTVTQERRPIFHDFRSGRLLVEEMRLSERDALVESLAWVIMPDHLHWLLVLRAGSLAALLKRLKARSARAINREFGSSGQLWQRGYYDRALRREEDLQAVARYIVANPLRAGITSSLGDYSLWDAVWL